MDIRVHHWGVWLNITAHRQSSVTESVVLPHDSNGGHHMPEWPTPPDPSLLSIERRPKSGRMMLAHIEPGAPRRFLSADLRMPQVRIPGMERQRTQVVQMTETTVGLIKRPWTEADNERLRDFVAQGLSIVRAAAAFNRTTKNVRIQARKIGTPFPPMRVFRKKFADVPSNFGRQY